MLRSLCACIALCLSLLWITGDASSQDRSAQVPGTAPVELKVEQQFIDGASNSSVREHFTFTVHHDAAGAQEEDCREWKLTIYRSDPSQQVPIWRRAGCVHPQSGNHPGLEGQADWEIPADLGAGTFEAEAELSIPNLKSQTSFVVSPSTSILFTGKLMGYFRWPDHQIGPKYKPGSGGPCEFKNDAIAPGPSRDGDVFLQAVASHPHEVLVGTGDNFAPNYFSRVFTDAAGNVTGQKELYAWNGGDWVPYDDNVANTAEALTGHATIPTDNVGCFLSRAGYDAIVPGKHDFYFGPQRLRALARFLASIPADQNDPRYDRDFQPVQMLAANLMIKTSWIKDHEPIPDSGKPKLPFTTKFVPLAGRGGRSLEIADFTDGGYVSPWMEFARITATGWSEDFLARRLKIFVCAAKTNPDEFLAPNGTCLGRQLDLHSSATDGKGSVHLVYELSAQNLASSSDSNYAICAYDPGEPEVPGQPRVSPATSNPYCVRFSLYRSFFQYPDWPRDGGVGPESTHYLNPRPYVLKNDHLVIFGVVDPKLGEHIGGDNFAWEDVRLGPRDHASDPPVDKRYTTQIAAADPVQSIIQLNDYFEHQYRIENHRQFEGIRVLLAQMPADEAKQLAEHLPRCARFDVVIAEADDALATADANTLVHPAAVGTRQRVCEGDGSAADSVRPAQARNGSLEVPPAVVLVPPTHERSPFKHDRAVQLRELSLTTDSKTFWRYRLSGDPIRVTVPDTSPVRSAAEEFWKAICEGLYKPGAQECKQPLSSDTAKQTSLIRQLALWAMYKYQRADIALLQERDFYLGAVDDYLADHCRTIPGQPICEAGSVSQIDVQEVLDRILWKGDFVELRLVQGSVVKSIMKQSESYSKVEKAAYLPVEEAGRALIPLGLQPDLKNGGDYLVNSKPMDQNELYTVATSDYIALGDTGYSDLAKPPVGDPAVPANPKVRIAAISTQVCSEVKRVRTDVNCHGTIKARDYYDQIANQRPSDPRTGDTNAHKLYAWSLLQPHLGQGAANLNAAEQRLADQSNWILSLDQFSIGFSALTHNGSEQESSDRFAGVQNGQVNAKHFHELDWDANSTFRLFHPHYDLFATETLQYYSNFTAQVSGPATETQSKNMFSVDSGSYFHLKPLASKTLPQFSGVLAGHFETQVGNPLTSVNLAPVPPSTQSSTLKFHQGRTNLALARVGLRLEDRKSYVEGGLEGGQTLNAIQAFEIFPAPAVSPFTCLLEATVSLSKCINRYNKTHPTTPVTANSTVDVLRHAQPRYGSYWKVGLTVPFHPIVSYNFQDTSDFFFLSGGDNSADTRFRHQLVHSLKFKVFPSLSFEPTYTIFVYQNKVDYHNLFQQQYSVKINYSFDCSNWHECWHQSQYKKPTQ